MALGGTTAFLFMWTCLTVAHPPAEANARPPSAGSGDDVAATPSEAKPLGPSRPPDPTRPIMMREILFSNGEKQTRETWTLVNVG